jgi:hypothetical protein
MKNPFYKLKVESFWFWANPKNSTFLLIFTYLPFFNGCKFPMVDRRHPYEMGGKKNKTKRVLDEEETNCQICTSNRHSHNIIGGVGPLTNKS